jgi:asparagine synthase (glutamine-hydrolysing)
VFGGYSFRYVPHGIEANVRRFSNGPALSSACGWLATRWPRSSRLPRALRLGNMLENLAQDPASAYYHDLCFLRPRATRALLGLTRGSFDQSHAFAAITDTYRRCPSRHLLQRAQYTDLKVYLANDVLVKVDRMSMAHGLEVRAPFLDRRIVEFAFRLPPAHKMPQLRPKHLLKRIARRRLPIELLTLPKRGFTAPMAEWIRGRYAGRFRDEVLTNGSMISTLVDMHELRRLFAHHVDGEGDHSHVLWAVWILDRWARHLHARPAEAGVPIVLHVP